MSDPENDNKLPGFFTEDGKNGDHKSRTGKGRWAVAALTLTVIALGAVIWLGTSRSDPQGSVPTITAEAGAYKKRPDDPGGRDIAHRESTVFRALQGDGASTDKNDKGIENLAARDKGGAPLSRDRFYDDLDTSMQQLAKQSGNDAETPDSGDTSRPETGPDQDATPAAPDDSRNQDRLEFLREVVKKKDKIEERKRRQQKQNKQQDNGDTAGQKQQSKTQSGEQSGPQKQKVAGEISAANPDEGEKAPAPAGSAPPGKQRVLSPQHYVQLGSFRNQDAARAAWRRAQDNYEDALEGVGRDIQRADLGKRGIFYRVRGGPVAHARALEICRAIKKTDTNGCMVVGADR
jgi:cell division protein FtsN